MWIVIQGIFKDFKQVVSAMNPLSLTHIFLKRKSLAIILVMLCSVCSVYKTHLVRNISLSLNSFQWSCIWKSVYIYEMHKHTPLHTNPIKLFSVIAPTEYRICCAKTFHLCLSERYSPILLLRDLGQSATVHEHAHAPTQMLTEH